ECEPGFVLAGNGRICLPQGGAFDCSPCTDDGHCESLAGGRCERFADGRFCTRGCAQAADCPDSFDCVLGRCWPGSRSCSCLPAHDGVVRGCFHTNAQGTCVGTQQCDAEAMPGWSECSAAEPQSERCDGLDNDCNGLVDEGLVHSDGAACRQENEWGSCRGVWLCAGEGGWRCSAGVPARELCNGRDDDCDGLVDEESPALQQPCFAGVGGCRVVGVARCTDDGEGTVCLARAGQPAPIELCDGQDDDCDGVTDEGYDGLNSPCAVGVGGCRASGVVRCAADGRSAGCSAQAGQARQERCNGLDDDCDGQIDEEFPALQQPCFAGKGACRAAGVARCNDAGDGTVCLAVAGQPTAELCDGVDNDCDDETDEGFAELHRACMVGKGICQAGGVVRCAADGRSAGCSAQPGQPREESCNGLDDDCDGEIDESFLVGGRIATYVHCGACGRSCAQAIANATTRCATELALPRCVVQACDPGYVAAGDDLCLPLSLGQCDPCLDDEGCLFPGAACTRLVDGSFCLNPCQEQGDCPEGTQCTELEAGAGGAGGGRWCLPATGACLCDGSDLTLQRGCQVDHEPGGGRPGYSCFGIRTCEPEGWSACLLPEESCNGFDDDCDGRIDEDFLDADGRLSGDTNCGECGNNCTLLVYP
ncbi:MAG: hypothetical protein FJ125_14050, partial [Deltaproteobacteria bacterium]|nr:hypothetical protein [Deltaproteobacteria bacterium]